MRRKSNVVSSTSWPSGSRIMTARPPMSVSSRISPPAGHDTGQHGGDVVHGHRQVGEAEVVHHPAGASWTPAPS